MEQSLYVHNITDNKIYLCKNIERGYTLGDLRKDIVNKREHGKSDELLFKVKDKMIRSTDIEMVMDVWTLANIGVKVEVIWVLNIVDLDDDDEEDNVRKVGLNKDTSGEMEFENGRDDSTTMGNTGDIGGTLGNDVSGGTKETDGKEFKETDGKKDGEDSGKDGNKSGQDENSNKRKRTEG